MVCTVKRACAVLSAREQADIAPRDTYIMLQFYAPGFPYLILNLVYFDILTKANQIYLLGLTFLICFNCAFLSLHLITLLIDFCHHTLCSPTSLQMPLIVLGLYMLVYYLMRVPCCMHTASFDALFRPIAEVNALRVLLG